MLIQKNLKFGPKSHIASSNMSGNCFSYPAYLPESPATAVCNKIYELCSPYVTSGLTSGELAMIRRLHPEAPEAKPLSTLEAWKSGGLRQEQALSLLPAGGTLHRKLRTTVTEDEYSAAIVITDHIVVKTTIRRGHSNRCIGDECNGYPCFAHREIRVLQRIARSDCSAVCLPIDFDVFPSGCSLVFPKLQFDLLDFIVDGLGPIDWQCLSSLNRTLYSALRHLHSLDIVHGDVKPDNVAVTADGGRLVDVKLIDLDQGIILTAIPDVVMDQDTKDACRMACFEHTPRYADPYAVLLQKFDSLIDGCEVRRVLIERDFWGLALTIGVAYTRRFFPAERNHNGPDRHMFELVTRPTTFAGALRETDLAIECMRESFEEVAVRDLDVALASAVRQLVFGALQTRVFDDKGNTASRRPAFEAAMKGTKKRTELRPAPARRVVRKRRQSVPAMHLVQAS
jgi:tRNA A-37 threonylcarbamoyl transferase component Bud32